jgi:hypothetical protein
MSKAGLRCDYCHSDSHTLNTNMECRAKYDEFEAFGNKYQYVFLALLALETLLFCIMVFFIDPWVAMGILLAAMGVTIAVFPFCTPETIEMVGVKGAIRLGRIIGAVLIAIGMALGIIFLL